MPWVRDDGHVLCPRDPFPSLHLYGQWKDAESLPAQNAANRAKMMLPSLGLMRGPSADAMFLVRAIPKRYLIFTSSSSPRRASASCDRRAPKCLFKCHFARDAELQACIRGRRGVPDESTPHASATTLTPLSTRCIHETTKTSDDHWSHPRRREKQAISNSVQLAAR
jgi:hypothetical protein